MARRIQILSDDGSEVLHPETDIKSVVGLSEVVEDVDENSEKIDGRNYVEYVDLESSASFNKVIKKDLSNDSWSYSSYQSYATRLFPVEEGNEYKIKGYTPYKNSSYMCASYGFSSANDTSTVDIDNIFDQRYLDDGNFELVVTAPQNAKWIIITEYPNPLATCAISTDRHDKGIEERVTDLEQKVGEDTLDELLSTLSVALNGTLEKVWDDVNKKYTFTFTPGT